MQIIFAPAIALLNRMSYTRKFTLLWLITLIAICVVVYSLFVNLNRVIQPSLRQLEGIKLITPISQTIQAIQLHRVISAVLLSGNLSMIERRASQEKQADAAFDAMEGKLPAQLISGKNFHAIKSDWQRLRKQGLNLTSSENLAAHTLLIKQLQTFKVFIADEYLLTHDPESASDYLIDSVINDLPHALEYLGRIRAYGTSILSTKQITEQQKIDLRVFIAEFDNILEHLNTSLDKSASYNPTIRVPLVAMTGDIAVLSQMVTGIVASDILTERFATPPVEFLEKANMSINRIYMQMYETLLPTTEMLIKERIIKAKNTLYISAGISLLLFLVMAYMSVSMYYAIIGSIKSLARSARAFADGDLFTRASLDTRDEISLVSDSFNEMADGFNALLNEHKRAEESLSKESRKNETLLRAASDGIHILDIEGNVVQVNDTFCKMLGYSAEELATMNAAQWDVQWTAEEIKANIAALGDVAEMLETRHRRRDGNIIDVEISITKVAIDGLTLVYCSSRDVTKRKQAELALVESKERLDSIIETAMDAVVQMNDQGVITGWNYQAEKIFGWSSDEAVGKKLAETIIPPQYREAHLLGFAHFLSSGKKSILNSRTKLLGLNRNGHEFPIELSITAVNTSGKYEFNGFIRDITRQKESEELIWNQANFDALTGLPNRHMFHDRLDHNIKKANRADLMTALLYIDLDRFKEVNDALGHNMGDILLKEAARRIGECVRETDTVARLGSDEFTVILADIDDTGSIGRIAENILQTLSMPYQLDKETAYVTASIGITLHPVDAPNAEELLKNADQAMYAAKNAGRNRFSYFTQSMQHIAQKRLHMINDLRGALSVSQFMVYYQPIVDMTTGQINKAEALIRWQHPKLGMISPIQFIKLAEETGLIIEIGDYVFKEAARQLKLWRTLFNPEFQISVNVSPIQLSNTMGISYKRWFSYLQGLELPGQSIVIEITEGLLLDADPDIDGKLLEFRDAGIQVAIDDFGTGYSSLSYLKKFDIDYLKIDQSFVRELETNSDDMALSEAIIVMAHKLGLKVIAEGVETEAQRKLLTLVGCDYAQGYLFSRPVPAEEFEKLFKNRLSEIKNFEI